MISDKITRAVWLLDNVHHAAMATVNSDGTPHNTPYFFIRNKSLTELFWHRTQNQSTRSISNALVAHLSYYTKHKLEVDYTSNATMPAALLAQSSLGHLTRTMSGDVS